MTKTITFPPPEQQISFTIELMRARSIYLQDALLDTVAGMNISMIDQELAEFVPPADLATMAHHGLRGELLFPVPAILTANPYLLGYYRLLMGYSQKEFYGSDKGFKVGYFKGMEAKGVISKTAAPDLSLLCSAFCASGSFMLTGLGHFNLNRGLLDSLTLLTVGPQLRGGANNKRGSDGIVLVFAIIKEIVDHAIVQIDSLAIELVNAAGRKVMIEFAADPDLIIREQISPGIFRELVAIEIKSGTDISNVHNRIGEAEKSHQKAKGRGFTECWTVHNVKRLDMKTAHKESPSTNRFYSLERLGERAGPEYEDFKTRVVSLTGIVTT